MRTPVIPGVNDNEEEIGNIAEYVGGLGGAQYYELLLFNPLGESKYDALQVKKILLEPVPPRQRVPSAWSRSRSGNPGFL